MEIINLKLFIGATIRFILQLFHKHAYPNPLIIPCSFHARFKIQMQHDFKISHPTVLRSGIKHREINNEHIKTSPSNITLLIRVIYLEVAH